MPDPVVEGWLYATMQVENPWKQKGTGFLIARGEGAAQRKFLVTNKHVLHSEKEKREAADSFTLHVNVEKGDGLTAEELHVDLGSVGGGKRWREHPDEDADVMVFDITDVFSIRADVRHKWMGYEDFPTSETLQREGVRIGDEVFTIGYPLGLTHSGTNLPLLRAGIISSWVGHTLEDRIEMDDGSVRERRLRGFLVDGGAISGSSGSPVVLRPLSGRYVGGEIQAEPCEALLLGIMAETRYVPIPMGDQEIPSYSGLGLAITTEVIRETIDLFGNGEA